MGLFSARISTKGMVSLCRQLSTTYNAGVPILRALDLVADQTRDRKTQNVIRGMRDRIAGGSGLGDAARAEARHFRPIFVELLAAGEVGGRLDVMLGDLADYYEDRLALQRKIAGALAYPALQLFLAWHLGTFALGLVRGLDLNARHSAFSTYIHSYVRFQAIAWLCFGVLFVACIALARLGIFKWIVGWVSTFVWPLAPITRWFGLARFFRTLSLLIGSGVSITACIERAAANVANPYMQRDLVRAVPLVREGASLADAFHASRSLTRTAREMLFVGEESGNLEGALQKVAEYHGAQGEHAVMVATKVGNVLVTLIVATVVGFVVISFYSNLYGGLLNDL